jgi:sugar phosphate isomerase/epimerase
MLRYAFMTFSTPSLSLDETLTVAGDYGYDGIEPRLDAQHAHGIEVSATALERNTIRRLVDESDAELACLATSLSYADPAKSQGMVAQTHERIDLAGDLAVPALRVFGGQIPAGVSREQAIQQLVDSLTAVGDHAGERGVTICLETHDDWCNPAHVATVLRRVNHPAVAANWDIMHPVRTGKATMDQAFEALRPWIRHLHVHDGGGTDLRFMSIGTGDIDHRRAMELLLGADYGGYVSGEWINWEPYDAHLPRELETLERYERELTAERTA